MEKKNSKKSIIAGGLISTGGFFIAKAIGLIYSIPFSYILGSDAYMSYYATAYRIYSYLLNIFTAGFPYGIATLVAKYQTLKNYKTVLSVKRLSLLFMMLLGFLGMVVMIALSAVIAPLISPDQEGTHILIVVLCILALAIFFVPLLSAYRGFIQGCKEMEEYAYSQAFEQVFRVGFLLSAACLAVYVFKLARVWALYAAVLSTSVAAVAGILQIRGYAKKQEIALSQLAKDQTSRMVALKPLAKEFILLALPYMLSAVLGYSDDIYNAILLPIGLRYSSYTPEQIDTVMSAANYVGTKLISIPMILAPGFTASIIPHISSALAEKKYGLIRKDIIESINIVFFIGGFLTFAIFLYAEPIYYTLFYTADLPLSSNIVRWITIEGFFGTITPIVSSIMMAVRLQKSLLKRLSIGALVKGILMIPLTMLMGFPGSVVATMISYAYMLSGNLLELKKKFGISYSSTGKVVSRTLIGLLAMGLVGWALMQFGIGAASGGKIVCLLLLAVNGLLASLLFGVVVLYLQVPQSLFHFRIKKPARA